MTHSSIMVENSSLCIIASPKVSMKAAGVIFILALGLVVVGIPLPFGRLNLSRIDCLSRDAILLTRPATKIDQFAAFGTKRSPDIILPLDRLSARRTFPHKPKVRRKDSKVK